MTTQNHDAAAPIMQLKVTQSDWQARVRGYPYRILEVWAEDTLDLLAKAILDSFDFMDDHMYGFYNQLKRWTDSTERYETGEAIAVSWSRFQSRSVHKTTIASAFDHDKKKLLFLYDYGDEWRFIVQRVKLVPVTDAQYPRVILSHGKALPQYDTYDEDDVPDDPGQS
ncbi:MAG: plasmid pRiA4b ORF-3 family protein [Alicyclobacillus sp.]|nr:plasmid pRiA4b ORF-3 family protein [Alicyclobacillus sp.]